MGQSPEPPSSLSEIPPNTLNYNAGPLIIWSLASICVVMLVIVGLRLWARRIKGLMFGLDDWLIIVCTVRLP